MQQPLYAAPAPPRPGISPDLPHRAAPAAPAALAAPIPLELPQRLMRHALAAAALALLLALVPGLLRVAQDTRQEMEGSLAQARLHAALAQLATREDAAALAELRELQGLRHLRLALHDGQGRALLALGGEDGPPALATLARALGLVRAEHAVSWHVPRPQGLPWTVTLTSSPDSELSESLFNLAGMFALLAGCCALMLAVMRRHVRRAFAPLQALLAAIARIERREPGAARSLPVMPVRELEAIAQALRQLGAHLEQSERERRLLAQRLLSLQEDERQRLARDLHDELGQRLTAVRVDAAWLQRRLADAPALQPVAAGIGEQAALLLQDVRRLLARLRPPGDDPAQPATLARLRTLLQELCDGWRASAQGEGLHVALQVEGDDGLALPQPLLLGLYRISQEALTNVARHARGARHASLALRAHGAVLHWCVQDDGCGLDGFEAALRRGSGLAGIKERVWALGGALQAGAGDGSAAGNGGRGLRLQAQLPLEGSA